MGSRYTAEQDVDTKFWDDDEAKDSYRRKALERRKKLTKKLKKTNNLKRKVDRKKTLEENLWEAEEKQKKLDQHHDALRSRVGYYIQNHLPIRLLQVSNMALVDRRTLQEQICEKITQRPSICSEDKCLCFEQIKDELKYSILSHRWGSPELTFSEFVKLHEQMTWRFWDGLKSPDTRALERMHEIWGDTPFKRSLAKLLHFRQVSAQRQCKYAWVDTICINKESSSELDESIRSMYAWYRDAHICIVHLNQTPYYLDMKDEPWFSRGWTLQELLAPKQIKFYSASWKGITRRENDKDLDSAEQQAAKEDKDNPSL
ncbi:hypothetical protein FRC16_007138, partial [Serendipita sp. 398]